MFVASAVIVASVRSSASEGSSRGSGIRKAKTTADEVAAASRLRRQRTAHLAKLPARCAARESLASTVAGLAAQ